MKACPPQSDKSGACPAETHFAFSSPTIDKSLVPRKYLIESFIFDLEFMFSSPVMPTSARIIRRAIQLIAVVAAIVGFLTLVLQTDTGHRSLDAEARRHQAAWVKLERSIPRYEPLPSHVIKGSRGVLLMGTSNTISLVLTTVELLRKTGCKLPVEFAYLPNEVSENDLERLRANDIKPRNYSNAQISSQNWSHEHLRLGVLKPFAVMSSPLQEVLFLDPDVIPLRDPTYLFATNKYREFGALFWPDFPATPRSNPIWRIMKQPYVFEREFETGIMVLDKARVGRPLVLAAHLCENAGYYFRYIWGDKDAFRWAFKVAKIPYYLNPNYLMSVGLLVSEQNPRGNVSLVETDGKLSPPEGAGYCGQNMVQMDFDDKFPMSSTFKPQPLFVHANGIKKNYYDDIPPFQVAQIYTGLPKRATLNSLRRGRYEWIGQFHEQDHCGKLAAQEGLAVSYLDFAKQFPGINEKYMSVRKTHTLKASQEQKTPGSTIQESEQRAIPESKALNANERKYQQKWVDFQQSTVYTVDFSHDAAASHIKRDSMGVTMMGTSKTINLAIMTAEVLRKVGCSLEIEFAYLKNEVTDEDLVKLKANNISTRDYLSSAVPTGNWGHEELRLGATKPYAILSSPFQHNIFIDPDVFPLRDPTYLFSTRVYASYGAIFWPDYPATDRDKSIWTIMKQPYIFEREFESGLMILDKARVWRGLKMAAHLCEHAKFYNRYLWGDKDTFRFGFKAAGLPYFLNPNYLVSLGVVVNGSHPLGNVSLVLDNASGKLQIPTGSTYCGQSMMQMNFYDGEDEDEESDFIAKPLFIHANGIRTNYKDDIPPFQVSQTYAVIKDSNTKAKVKFDFLQVGKYHWIGQAHGQDHCGRMEEESTLEIVNSDFCKEHPGVNELYIEVRRKVYSLSKP